MKATVVLHVVCVLNYDNMMASGLCLRDWRSRLIFRTCAESAKAHWEPTKTFRNHSILPGEEKGGGNNNTEELSVAVLQHACNTRGRCPIHSQLLKLTLAPTLSGSNLLGMFAALTCKIVSKPVNIVLSNGAVYNRMLL